MSETFIDKLSCLALHVKSTMRSAKLYKIFPAGEGAVLLRFRKESHNIFLRLSADSACPHFLLQKEKTHTLNSREVPPTFTVVARKRLTGLYLDNVQYHPRALELTFVGNDNSYVLVLKLSPNAPNIYLLDSDRKIVADIFSKKTSYKILDSIKEEHVGQSSGRTIDHASSISEEINTLYLAAKEEKSREILAKGIAKNKKRLLKLIKNLEQDKNKLEKFRHYKLLGELAKCHFYLMKKGMTELTVPDLFAELPEETPVTIPLNPAKSPQENVEILFTKSKKYERGMGKVDERLLAAREELAVLHEDGVAATSEVHKNTTRQKKYDRKTEFRHFTSYDGITILVGRSSRENDRLTMVVAKGNDLWLHAVNYPGSHVIVKLPGKEIPQETLLDAAALAIFYSKAKKQCEGEVVYTRRKNVRKPKKAKPGAVLPSQSRYIYIKQEEKRIDRLFNAAKE